MLSALADAGWAVDHDDGRRHDLVIVDCRMTVVERHPADPTAPRGALIDPGGVEPAGYDFAVAIDVDRTTLSELFAAWRPSTGAVQLERVAEALGHDAIRPIARGLLDELRNAVTAMDGGRYDTAHRIAGLAGTMGFDTVSAPWNALSHGDLNQSSAARREARLAIAALVRWLGEPPRGDAHGPS